MEADKETQGEQDVKVVQVGDMEVVVETEVFGQGGKLLSPHE